MFLGYKLSSKGHRVANSFEFDGNMTGRPDLLAILQIDAHAGQETGGGIESVCIEMDRTPTLLRTLRTYAAS